MVTGGRQKQMKKCYFNSQQLPEFSNRSLGLKKWKLTSYTHQLDGMVLKDQKDFGILPLFAMPCIDQGLPTAAANNPNFSGLTS